MNRGEKMFFLYELVEQGIRITRAFGWGDCVTIPETVQGKAVTELGDYVFSDRMDERMRRQLMDSGRLCTEDGEDVEASVEGLPEVTGNRIVELRLPSGLIKIGRYAFYNCGCLQSLKFGGMLADIGAGALTGCHKIRHLEVSVREDGISALREFLTELPEELRVDIRKDKEKGRFWFPEFFEEGVENTPARILENHVHGSGIRYRNCFIHKSLQIKEYDELFEYARAWEKEGAVVALALDRILYPMELSIKARERYLNYLKEHVLSAFTYLAEEKEYASLGRILEEIAPDQEKMDELLAVSEEKGDMECISLLMDYLHRHTKKQRRIFEF